MQNHQPLKSIYLPPNKPHFSLPQLTAGSENSKYLYPYLQSNAAVLINMHIWRSSTFREICMFSFGKNLAQALMKYLPIDPPAAAPCSTYGHCSTPLSLTADASYAPQDIRRACSCLFLGQV